MVFHTVLLYHPIQQQDHSPLFPLNNNVSTMLGGGMVHSDNLPYAFIYCRNIYQKTDTLPTTFPYCAKISKKVAFNIASEASYVYILSGQKLIKMPEMVHLETFWKPGSCGQTMLPDRSLLIGQKLVENVKIKNFKCVFLSDFQTLWWHFKEFWDDMKKGCVILMYYFFSAKYIQIIFSYILILSLNWTFMHKWTF